MIVDDIQDDAETGAVSLIHKVAERIRYPVKPCWSEQVDSIVAPGGEREKPCCCRQQR